MGTNAVKRKLSPLAQKALEEEQKRLPWDEPIQPEDNHGKVRELLSSTHAPGVPHWTTAQMQDAYKLLYRLNQIYDLEDDRNERIANGEDPYEI